MAMERIELTDGTVIDGSVGYYNGPQININMKFGDLSYTDIAKLMDPKNMRVITYYYGAFKNIYHGFTKFTSMERTADDGLIIRLSGTDTHVEFKIPTVPAEYIPGEL